MKEKESVNSCVFCDIFRTKLSTSTGKPIVLFENKYFWVMFDESRVTPRHVLIIPVRHVEKLTDLNGKEQEWFWVTLARVRRLLKNWYGPHGFNYGINEGIAAGQTVNHLHIHVFDRYEGDVKNPRGGIRNFKKSIVPY